MRALVTGWGQFPSIRPRPTLGELAKNAGDTSPLRCPRCREIMTFATLQDMACPKCPPSASAAPRQAAFWQASRKQSIAVALVTLVSGFGVMLLALLAWGGRSELDAAYMPGSGAEARSEAWAVFQGDSEEEWHSLPVLVQQTETAFVPLPVSWELEGKAGGLVWVFQEHVSSGYLARFLGDDGQRLKALLAKHGALKLTVEARRHPYQTKELMEIGRVERLGWGKGHQEFELPHRSLAPAAALTASAWLEGVIVGTSASVVAQTGPDMASE